MSSSEQSSKLISSPHFGPLFDHRRGPREAGPRLARYLLILLLFYKRAQTRSTRRP